MTRRRPVQPGELPNEELRQRLRAIMTARGVKLDSMSAADLRTLLCNMGVPRAPLAYYERLLEKEPRQ